MKILDRVEPPVWKFVLTCSCCRSTLEIDADDVRVTKADHQHPHSCDYYVDCPVCGADPCIDAQIIPANVKRKAENRSDPHLQTIRTPKLGNLI